MTKTLGKEFFNRKTLLVARDLIGKYLIRRLCSTSRRHYGVAREKIIEVEAYVGPHDLACHSSKGKTRRTEVMFCEAGTLYVYFVYGMYWMLNVVTEEKNYPAAILIRGTEHFRRPGVLTRELKITGALNGRAARKRTGLWFEDRGEKIPQSKIKRTPRIGISYAGPIWSKKKYRFTLK
ncbi:DNA-3-methyladenine glycosylase [Patescibacteria group bacterium]|nr:MAG: DNA-3-methyladenine glycosylase [Patescibacteria group bacterium]